MLRRIWPCILIVLILCVIVIYVPCRFELWCWPCFTPKCPECPECPSEPTGSAEANLRIEHEDLMAFTQINNSFSSLLVDVEVEEGEDCSPDMENYWSGLLFQLGDYSSSCSDYQGVILTLDDDTTVELNRTDFQWINIVSVHDRNKIAGCDDTIADCYKPMETDEVLTIFPSTTAAGGGSCCWTTSTCRQGAPFHKNLSAIPNIITYWAGSSGYDMSTRYDAAPDDSHVSYDFVFKDEFIVGVYTISDDGSGSCTVALKDSDSLYTDVKKIEVAGGSGGSGGGVRQDPPIP